MASQADIIAGIIKKSVDKAKAGAKSDAERRAAEERAAADPAVAAQRDSERRKANRESGGGPRTGADGFLDMAEQAWTDGTTEAKEKLAAAAPPDTYDATLREIARANTQLSITATNGRAGSVLGIGTDSYGAAQAARSNDRIGGDPRYRRREIGGGNPNMGQRRAGIPSLFNLPFSTGRGLGVTRGARF